MELSQVRETYLAAAVCVLEQRGWRSLRFTPLEDPREVLVSGFDALILDDVV